MSSVRNAVNNSSWINGYFASLANYASKVLDMGKFVSSICVML